ncbi:hypothetical protein ACXYN8_06255 [Altererythrobacter sp. CAU 1778]
MRRMLAWMAMLTMFTGPVYAQAPQIARSVFVERVAKGERGDIRTVESLESVRSGDRVVTVLQWNGARRDPFTVTSPVPRTLRFVDSSVPQTQVSTDGGRSWTMLAAVRPESVTHLRWKVRPGIDRLSYSAVVR